MLDDLKAGRFSGFGVDAVTLVISKLPKLKPLGDQKATKTHDPFTSGLLKMLRLCCRVRIMHDLPLGAPPAAIHLIPPNHVLFCLESVMANGDGDGIGVGTS